MKSDPGSIPLFRQEAIDARNSDAEGKLLIPLSTTNTVLTLVVLLSASALIASLFVGTYTSRVQARGWLTYFPAEPEVTSDSSGIASKVWIQVGDRVETGDALFTVSQAKYSAENGSLNSMISDRISSEIRNVKDQLALLDEFGKTEIATLRQQISAKKRSLSVARNMQKLVSRRLQLAKSELARFEDAFNSGAISASSLESAQDQVISAEFDAMSTDSRESDIKADLITLEGALNNAKKSQQVRRSELDRELNVLNQKLIAAAQQGDVLIASPISGVVTTIISQQGEFVSAGSVVASIRPDDAKLRGEIILPTRSSPYVESGMRVNIRFDSFPYQKYGQFVGTVESIGSIVLPANTAGFPAIAYEPFVIAQIDIADEVVSLDGKNFRLRSGMQFNASIEQETKPAIQWLLGPLYRAFQGH